MTLNIRPMQGEGGAAASAEPPNSGRQRLTERLLAEMTAWSPRDRAGAFKRWHRGALNVVHLSLLSTLEARGAQPMGVLADELDVSVASATGIVDRMTKRGLVERRHVAADRRVVLVEATEKGLATVRLVGDHRLARFARLLEYLNEDQLAALLAALRAMRAASDAIDAAEAAEAAGGAAVAEAAR
jgi:DNA-binding MarR family transcriptional regulator